jgi:hypothetical protein
MGRAAAVAVVSPVSGERWRAMPIWPQPPPGWNIWRRSLIVLAALSLLSGCGTPNTDFGRVRPSLVSEKVHDWVGPAADSRVGAIPSSFELTDDERQLRDLAFPLIEPPYDRKKWDNVLREYGLAGDYQAARFDRTVYAARLLSSHYTSPASRYARLMDDIRNDITSVPAFFETAARVADMDAKRGKSLAFVSELSPGERANALRRNHENALILAWVRDTLGQRASSYRFALERLAIVAPSPEAGQVDLTLNQLRAIEDRYRTALPLAYAPRTDIAY